MAALRRGGGLTRETELYERNSAAFREHQPGVWAMLERIAAPVSSLVPGEDGPDNIDLGDVRLYPEPARAWTETQVGAYFENPDRIGFDDPSHCNISPVSKLVLADIRRFFRDRVTADFDSYPVIDIGYAFVFGVGLGYHVPTMIERRACRYLILIEPVAEFLLHSMRAIDWAQVFSDAEAADIRILFIVGETPEDAQKGIENIIIQSGDTFLDGSFAYVHYYSWALQQGRALLNERIKNFYVSAGFFEDEILMMKNSYGNFRRWPFHLVDRRPFVEQSMPMFVVGSGPSLDADLPYIRQWRDRAMVFSCGTSLGILLKNGIRPDLHVENENTQPLVENLRRWKAEYGFEGITLVASSTVVPEVSGLFDKRWFFFRWALSSSTVLNPNTEPVLYADPLVANAAAAISAQVGFQTVYLFGVDCGRQVDGEHHASDAVYYDDAFEIDPNDRPDVGFERLVPENFGGTVLTSRTLDLSRRTLATLQVMRDFTLFNCSNGARIEGVRPKTAAAIHVDTPPGRQEAVLARIEAQMRYYEAEGFLAEVDLEPAINGCDEFAERFAETVEAAKAEDDSFWAVKKRLLDFWADYGETCQSVLKIIGGSFNSILRLGAFGGNRLLNEATRRAYLGAFLDSYRDACVWMAGETRTLLAEMAERRDELTVVGVAPEPQEDPAEGAASGPDEHAAQS